MDHSVAGGVSVGSGPDQEWTVATVSVVPTKTRTAAVGKARLSASKRAFDLGVAAAALLLFAPVFLAVWLAVRATSPGPGLFWSQRVGRDGRLFRMPKFRTMCVSAPAMPREQFSGACAYLTPIGEFLRFSSLDELPQLWSIFVGDMSLVGPRPLLPQDPASLARMAYPEIARVRPGLTGLAQINGRNAVKPMRKARYDALYARHGCWKLDLMILRRTIVIVFRRTGIL